MRALPRHEQFERGRVGRASAPDDASYRIVSAAHIETNPTPSRTGGSDGVVTIVDRNRSPCNAFHEAVTRRSSAGRVSGRGPSRTTKLDGLAVQSWLRPDPPPGRSP